ncbi:DUF6573 family protein [Xanthomonas albilineans]|uniref:Uncharacterized protein n=1 Tax=Xanthomonas albilineans (strain GPE PC73 / CFBP 7063) TaxID=380358 RepID=D6CKC6_XANAP|nr:DUF6573 family protein [Xanthomonas albilineans]CAZ15915.1 conserved hypothetical protein [Xanthomonas albilineans]
MFTSSDLIHTYTRANMLENGELIDVTETGRKAGFVVPVALTRAVWTDCVEWSAADNTRKHSCEDEARRLWDVVYMARVFAARNGTDSRLAFPVYRIPREGRGTRPRLVRLHIHIGPGDAGEPVITIMHPDE